VEKKICIAGAGTYGSYLANAIQECSPNTNIVLIETGDKHIKSEEEIGFSSSLKENNYNAASKGRFFGLGGTSAKWGGQLLFFSENDCISDASMDSIKQMNYKYKDRVLARFFEKAPMLEEKRVGRDLYIKSGIWLQFNKRNLFTYFQLSKKPKIEVITNARVKKINFTNRKVDSITILQDGIEQYIHADIFYITCGALETMRLLAKSDLFNLEEVTRGFADHVSTRCFSVQQLPPILCGHNFMYKFVGGSLVTSRIIGELDGVTFYMQPVFNEQFVFFQVLKNLMFKGQFSFVQLLRAAKQFLHLFPFISNYIFKKQLYVYRNWEINIDIEIKDSNNFINHSSQNDSFGIQGIDIFFNIPESTIVKIDKAKSIIRDLLKKEGLPFTEVAMNSSALKLEDTYHPYKMYNQKMGIHERFNPLDNLYVCHTGILDRAGGLNPTAVLFCMLEDHIDSSYKNNFKSI
jgi:hypothetical protein